jgi:glycosyltransferase involved in cell wall biosynthesis
MQKKILIILEAGKINPSGITRALIYRNLFKKNGYKCKFINRNSSLLLHIIINPPSILGFMNPRLTLNIAGKLNSIYSKIVHKYILKISEQFDIVYTSKVQDWDLIYKLKVVKKRRIVYDFGDSVWLFSNGQRFNEIISIVDTVTTDNKYVLDYVIKYNKNCVVIPDYPQLDIFDKLRVNSKKQKDKIVIGWIGSPTTLFNISLIWDVIHFLFTKYNNIHLRLVGVGKNNFLFPDYSYIDYSIRPMYNQKQMVEEVLNMDIGLFPLQNIESSVVRGVLKASVYMCGAVPVIGSAMGEMNDFIQDGQNGFLASNMDEWKTKLELLIEDKSLRERIGQNGLTTVRTSFSLDDNFDLLTKAFDKNLK